MSRPRFFIAGNSKSGTTALYQFLREHPAIFMPSLKEPNYFARDFCRDPDPSGSFHPRAEADYLSLFAPARPDQLCGEASACYLFSRVAAEEIKAFDPAARLIVILREPVDFLHSYHLQLLKNPITEGESIKDFAEALTVEDERRRGHRIPPGCLLPEFLHYRERIKYADQLERLYASFDPSQVLVLIYDDFKQDNSGTYRTVLSFLGVDPDFEPELANYNEGTALRSKAMQRLMRRLTFGQGWGAPAKAVVKGVVPARARRWLVDAFATRLVFAPKREIEAALAAKLRREFKGEVDRTARLLGRDLVALWRYDEL